MPSYNERDSILPLISRVRAATPHVDLLVIDDDSPDGTGRLADERAVDDTAVHVLHRSEKSGLGAAYRAGFAWALDRGFDVLVEMDADGSHRPEELQSLLDAATGADVVLGSRWVEGGSVIGWPLRRQLLSRGGSWYAREMLALGQRDVTGGYRAFRADALRRIRPEEVLSQGYCFQIEMLWRAVSADLHVVEVPITFAERELGVSKMTGSIVVEAMTRVTRWGFRARVSGGVRRAVTSAGAHG